MLSARIRGISLGRLSLRGLSTQNDFDGLVRSLLHKHGGGPLGVTTPWLSFVEHHLNKSRPAVVHEDATGATLSLSYGELAQKSRRFAAGLSALGIKRGDRVATLLPKGIDIVIATTGIWHLGAIHVPLFTAFGPQAVALRVSDCKARAVITDTENVEKTKTLGHDLVTKLFSDRLEEMHDSPPIVVVSETPGAAPEKTLIGGDRGFVPFASLLQKSDAPAAAPAQLMGSELIGMIYTSGTTGNPKCVPIPAKALAAFETYMKLGIDLRDDDVFCNAADPGWAYGLYYGIMGPLLLGQTIHFQTGKFSGPRLMEFVERHGITNLAAGPAVFNALRTANVRGKLRRLSSAGAPLPPSLAEWAREAFGAPIRDHYGQSEMGMMINNHWAEPLGAETRAGSIGKSMPGFRSVALSPDGLESSEGAIAVDMHHSPLMWFNGYQNNEGRTAAAFTKDLKYYKTGDTGRIDADGFIYFGARADDVISYHGYRIGPSEVEAPISGHPSVADVAAVGVKGRAGGPNDGIEEVVKAFVVLRPTASPSAELAQELANAVRQMAAHIRPREVEFVESLPKTPSGKTQHMVLRSLNRGKDCYEPL